LSKFDSTRFGTAGPLFNVTSGRARKVLEADVLMVLLIDRGRSHVDMHLDYQSRLADKERIFERLREIDLDTWGHFDRITKSCLCRRNGGNHLANEIMEILDVNCVIVSPFSTELSSSGYVIWGWKREVAEIGEYILRSELMAEQISLSLSASLSEKRSGEQGEKLAALLDLSTHIYSSLNYKDVVQKAVKLSMEIVGATGGTIFLLDKDEGVLLPLLTVDEAHADAINAMRLKLGEGLTGWVAQTGVSMISNYTDENSHSIQVPGTPDEIESLISVPLTWSGDVIGAITLRNSERKIFAQEDLEILTIFARQVADAIENARLYEKLEKAYDELSTTQDRLIMAEKLRALGDMAGGVAHDFNNILGTILGRIQLVGRKINDPEIAPELQAIEKATLEGRATVRRLQDFTHVSSRSEYERVDLRDVVREAIETTSPAWKSTAHKKGVTIELHTDLQVIPTIEGNREELREAVSNVILNAVDALPRGGNIWIGTRQSDDRVVVRIADDGIGMDDNTKDKMFFPFYSTKGTRGSGMGLSIVYGIMYRHQAEISVETSPGKGAEFIFKFGITENAEQRVIANAPSEEKSSLKILLVDDDPALLGVVEDMIDYLGHTCSKTDSGREAIEMLGREAFDMVVTDLGMPDVNGWDVAGFCKRERPDMPVVLISGWGAQIDDREARERVDAVLAKPFRIEEFEETINSVFSKGIRKQTAHK
jgi:signal transduction histidine kinase/CheY-like chemotaxis protein